DQLVVPSVGVHGKRQLPCQPIVIEDQRLARKPYRLSEGRGRKESVDVVLDPAIGRAEVLGEEPGLLAVAGEEVAGQVEHLLVTRVGGDLDSHRGQLEQNRADSRAPLRQPRRPVRFESDGTFQLHGWSPVSYQLSAISYQLIAIGVSGAEHKKPRLKAEPL